MQQMMYRLGMAERIHLGTQAGAQRGVEGLAQAGAWGWHACGCGCSSG